MQYLEKLLRVEFFKKELADGPTKLDNKRLMSVLARVNEDFIVDEDLILDEDFKRLIGRKLFWIMKSVSILVIANVCVKEWRALPCNTAEPSFGLEIETTDE